MKNQVTIGGRISSHFTYDHEFFGEKYYKITVTVERTSGYADIIPVIISERLINVCGNYKGAYIAITGQFRSYNLHENMKTRLLLFIFATYVELIEYPDNVNDVFIEGYISKQPVYRLTPLGREIADIMLAANRAYGKSDYIPCICWGRNARYVKDLDIGDSIRVSGRIQSREYNKGNEIRTAYELSVNLIESV